MNWQIPLSTPDLGPAEEAAVLRVLRSGWLTMGEETQAFEQEFAQFLGVRHALARAHGVPVIEDACHAPGGTYQGVAAAPCRLGTLGDVGCFSFCSNKNLATGEGGIQTSLHYPLVPGFAAFAAYREQDPLPVASAFCLRTLTLPLYPGLTEQAVTTVADLLLKH